MSHTPPVDSNGAGKSERDKLIEECLDNLWETCIDVEIAYQRGEYTTSQYLDEKQSAINDTLKQIKAAETEYV